MPLFLFGVSSLPVDSATVYIYIFDIPVLVICCPVIAKFHQILHQNSVASNNSRLLAHSTLGPGAGSGSAGCF